VAGDFFLRHHEERAARPLFLSNYMIIGGLEKMTLIDYPGQLAAIIFTKGCNFRCHFCYNPLLVWSETESGEKKYEKGYAQFTEDDLFRFLESRQGKLDGVVITGGEPTMHSDLPEFIKKIRAMGYKIKLDTNGTNPEMLKNLLDQKLLDYIAMDLKGSSTKYEQVVGIKINFSNLQKSVKLIISSGLPHEFRTTVVPGLLVVTDFEDMGKIIEGADAWYLQKFKSDVELVDRSLEKSPAYSAQEMLEMENIGKKYVKICEVR
jgi:pyruvate formate lyase activating enzyme